MMRLSDHLGTDDLREIHLAIFHDDSEYLRSGPFGLDEHRRTQQRIRNVPGKRLRRILDAVADFSEEGVRSAWAHFMAVAAGTHIWPDANHRTAIVAFDEAIQSGLGLTVYLPEDEAAAMVRESKAMRDPAHRTRGRYYTVAELADPGHPYRRLFAGYQDRLIVEPA